MAHAPTDTLRSQIAGHIISRITTGEWTAGARIPSESQLMQLFGASRMTVHHAVRDLTARGFLTRRSGAGTYVAPARPYIAEYRHQDIIEEITARGGVHQARIITRAMVAATAEQAACLNCATGMMLFHAVILHCEDGRPLELEDRLINPVELPDCVTMDLSRQTLFSRLMLMRPYREGSESMRAVTPDAREQQLLDIDSHTPCLETVRRTWTDDGGVTFARLLRAGPRAVAEAIVRPVQSEVHPQSV